MAADALLRAGKAALPLGPLAPGVPLPDKVTAEPPGSVQTRRPSCGCRGWGARHILRTPAATAWLPPWGGPRPRLGIPQTPTWHVPAGRTPALPAHSTRGYLYLLEVHRLADELVVLGQLLAGRQLDEHLAELTSTTTVRRDTAASLTGPACWGALAPCPAPPTRPLPHCLRTEPVRNSKLTRELFPVPVLSCEFWNIPEGQPCREARCI